MSRHIFAAVGVLVALLPRPTQADPAPAAKPASAACDRESTALTRAACLVADALAGAGNSALVVAAPASADARAALPPQLTQRLAELAAARLGVNAHASREPLALAEAERAASSGRGLVYLSVALFRDRLDVSADLYT
ncbi:MAG TPA: hypothetical protein VGL19_21115, partial [Polyangiaceae bacterium]